MRVLLVDGFAADEPGRTVVGVARDQLERAGHTVVRIDLEVEGFGTFMSPDERAVYHEQGANLITDAQRRSAKLLGEVDALLVCCTIRGGVIAPMVKSWLERVFVPGVSFTFTPRGRVTGALVNLRRVGLITTADRHDREAHRRSSSGRSVMRAVRLSSYRFCRTTYTCAGPGDEISSVVATALTSW